MRVVAPQGYKGVNKCNDILGRICLSLPLADAKPSECTVGSNKEPSVKLDTIIHSTIPIVPLSLTVSLFLYILCLTQSLYVCLSLSLWGRQPWYFGWGFNLPRGQALLDKWNQIPDSTDILVTHCPQLGESLTAAVTVHSLSHLLSFLFPLYLSHAHTDRFFLIQCVS